MAEIEIGEMKITGGKLLVILPLLGTLFGALWAGFELYQRLLTAEEAIVNYVSPDFSHYDENLAVLQTQLENIEADIDEIMDDINSVEKLARDTDDNVAETQRELRDDVYALEERVNDSLRETDRSVRELREDLEERIEKILDNPLNNED